MAKSAVPGGAEDELISAKKTVVHWKDAQHYEHRIIHVHQFKQMGIEAPHDVHWFPVNGFRQDKDFLLSFMTPEQYQAVVSADPRFEEVEVDV